MAGGKAPIVGKLINPETEFPEQRYPAVMFRNRLYISAPRHQDAMNLLYGNMSEHARHRLQDRIAEGKEKIAFGFARSDGSEWLESDCQAARIRMYIEGF